jgi:HD-like signal output (HDOD) protein
MKTDSQSKYTYVLDDIIGEIENSGISSVCRTINKFNKLMDDSNVASKNEDLEKLIREDISLAVTVLKTANSPLFRSANKQGISNISNAIKLIGWDTIYKIGMSLTVKGLVKTSKGRTFANWMITRSITVANISEIFLEQLRLKSDKLSELHSVYAYGLLHDIGALALLQVIEQYQQDVMEIKLKDDEKNWSDAENILYGFDHNIVGEKILMKTHLPRSFSFVARYHHIPDPMMYPASESKKISLIRLAQASLIDPHKFSEHCAFSNFKTISESSNMIREFDDLSEALQSEFEQELGLTKEFYNEIKSSKLSNEFIKNIAEQF